MGKIKLGIREYVAIAILVIGLKLTDDVPTVLYQTLASAAWMAPIISGIITILPIYLLIKVITLYENKNLLDIIVHLFGKYIGFFVLFLLFSHLSLIIIIQSAIYADIIKVMYFSKTPILLTYGLLMGVTAYGASKGPELIGSAAWLFLPYVQISLFISFLLTIVQGEIDFLFPLMGYGLWEIIKESSIHLALYVDFLFLCILIPHMKSIKEFKKGTWIALGILIMELAIAVGTYIILFDFETAKLMNYPFHEAIHLITFGFLTNIELLFFPFWLIATFIRFSMLLYLNAALFGKAFNIKQFEFIIPIAATLILFIGLIPTIPSYTLFDLRRMIFKYSTPIFFFLPLIIWLLAKLRGDFNNEKQL